MAHILPAEHQCVACGRPLPRYTSAAPAQASPRGWECPRCGSVWNPAVLACHHCPAGPAL